MATVSRTFGPLHFEDLDPKRFEDLARQLIYDFRNWYKLEATGRGGDDDGFDARAIELAGHDEIPEDREELTLGSQRTWLIQCKREKKLSPKKLSGYLSGIRESAGEPLHGLIFVAACDFSKKARDAFNLACREMGLQEWFLIGKAELEDQLMRPKYDHLLYGYFGVSLGGRRTNTYASLRRSLAAKRKAIRVLEDNHRGTVLIRAADAEDYPHPADPEKFKVRPGWVVRNYLRYTHEGLLFLHRRHFAFLAGNSVDWDAAFVFNDAISSYEDHWSELRQSLVSRHEVFTAWNSFGEDRAWLEIQAVIPYDRIIELDEHGDDLAEFPQLIVERDERGHLFSAAYAEISTIGAVRRNRQLSSPDEDRVSVFPEHFREEE